MKNVHARRLAAATALAMLTAGGSALAAAESQPAGTNSVSGHVGQLAQADNAAPEDEALKQQKQAEEEAARAAQEAEAAKAAQEAEAAKAAQEAEAAKAAQEAEAAKAAQEAEAAKAAQEAEAAKAAQEAEAAKAAQEAEAAKAAQEAEAAKAAQEAEAAKAAQEAEAAKAAQEAEAAKAAQEAEAAKAAQEAEAAKAAQEAEAAKPAPEQQAAPAVQPTPEQQAAPAVEPTPSDAAQPAAPAVEPTTRAERQKLREERRKQRQEAQEQQADQDTKEALPAVPLLPGSDTPVLDSQKDTPVPAEAEVKETAQPVQPPAPPPISDQDAQKETVKIEDIIPVTREEGRRVEGQRPPREERREGADILREIGGRIIIDLGGRPVVESSDRPRMSRDAREVYYEELPRGRTRETIVRPNGVEIVTVRDRYGEVIRRSRIMPDGREYVLVYVDEERRGPRDGRWRDPGDDLPPLVLTIPADEYILDAEQAESDDDYYEFLDQPPVERVERLYSVDEVKRSARVRDTVRRVDLDTITFGFGSAEIDEDAISRLDNVAKAMERMLEQNPAETFLIEGHTDAVGSDMANLALSDRRAEAVASALTDVFEIPPENLTTQGYGEQYLKVKTDAPEERNRRVAIRRITPLVSPVASAR